MGADYPQALMSGSDSDIVVMKFGGTSVAGAEQIKRAAGRIVAAREAGNRVVAVLSARGKTTDELVSQAQEISARPVIVALHERQQPLVDQAGDEGRLVPKFGQQRRVFVD